MASTIAQMVSLFLYSYKKNQFYMYKNNKIITFLRKRKNNRKSKKFYKYLINKNDLCFDIGANIGKKSKLF